MCFAQCVTKFERLRELLNIILEFFITINSPLLNNHMILKMILFGIKVFIRVVDIDSSFPTYKKCLI